MQSKAHFGRKNAIFRGMINSLFMKFYCIIIQALSYSSLVLILQDCKKQ